jgi:Raf kinase inhibitor-like YbhB/YbcL family protein
LEISCGSFKNGEGIPPRFTCRGEDVNPAFSISAVPEGARSLAIIMDDPDAPMGTWVHWVVWGIDPSLGEVPESARGVGVEGKNSSGRAGYHGPCPPPGKPHRYFFKVYALDVSPSLRPGSDKAALEKAMEGHVLAKAELMGTFQR